VGPHIPGWWKKTAKEVPSTFNARAETVAQKPMFRSAFKRPRRFVRGHSARESRSSPFALHELFELPLAFFVIQAELLKLGSNI